AGKLAWSRQDIAFFSIPGLGASPILYKDLLIMPFDGNDEKDPKRGFKQAWEGAFVAAFDKQTGKDRWRGRRGLSRQGHVTPMVIDVGGKPLLISAGGDVVQAFNPDTGELIWTVKSQGEGVVPSIVFGQGLVYTASGYERPAILWRDCARRHSLSRADRFSSARRESSIVWPTKSACRNRRLRPPVSRLLSGQGELQSTPALRR